MCDTKTRHDFVVNQQSPGFFGLFTTRNRAGRSRAVTGLVGGILVFGIIWMQIGPSVTANYPPIHDISTDTGNAPVFVALVAAREAAPNKVEYRTDYTQQQLEAYPELGTYETQASGADVFSAAQEVVAAAGWELADAVLNDGRIEATAQTRIYAFKDDVVIRISPTMDGTTLVDVRSASRVGTGDLGVNARRIQMFLGALDQKLQQ